MEKNEFEYRKIVKVNSVYFRIAICPKQYQKRTKSIIFPTENSFTAKKFLDWDMNEIYFVASKKYKFEEWVSKTKSVLAFSDHQNSDKMNGRHCFFF